MVLGDEKLDMSKHCVLEAQKTSCILGCGDQHDEGGDSSPLFCPGEA